MATSSSTASSGEAPAENVIGIDVWDLPAFRNDNRLIEHEPCDISPDSTDPLFEHSQHITALIWYKCNFNDATLQECREFLHIVCGISVSRSTVYRALLMMGFHRKIMKYSSKLLDVSDQVAFWVNEPDHSTHPGVCRLRYHDLVDLDESAYSVPTATLAEDPCHLNDTSGAIASTARPLPDYFALVAIDARKGVLNTMLLPHGATHEGFYHFVVYLLIPSLAGTGRRVVTMDKASAEHADGIEALTSAGHLVVYRPAASATFGPLEWVFTYVDKFLQHYSTQVNASNLKAWIRAALNTVSKEDVMGFMSEAHFCVPGHPFTPYSGEEELLAGPLAGAIV